MKIELEGKELFWIFVVIALSTVTIVFILNNPFRTKNVVIEQNDSSKKTVDLKIEPQIEKIKVPIEIIGIQKPIKQNVEISIDAPKKMDIPVTLQTEKINPINIPITLEKIIIDGTKIQKEIIKEENEGIKLPPPKTQ